MVSRAIVTLTVLRHRTRLMSFQRDGNVWNETASYRKEVPYVKEEIIMKKLIVLAAAALMAAGAQAAYKDGSYTGEGKGRESQIQVQVDVKGGKVAAVKVLKHGETEMIFAAAAETLCPAIVAKNGVDGVESVAGATLSSDGIKAAVKDALSKAQ